MTVISEEKSILITGGTSGLGLELAKLFLNNGYKVIALGRQPVKLTGYEERFKLYRVDFTDMVQVAAVTNNICETYNLNTIINNAGILSPPDYATTLNGFEYTFQVNYLTHLLINEIVLQNVNNKHPLKIVAVISPVYRMADKELTISSGLEGYSAVKSYSSSKLYMTLMCEYIPLRYPELNLQCFSFDPGTFSSAIYRMQKTWFRGLYRIAAPFMRHPEKVAKVLKEILEKKEIESAMIYDIKKRTRSVPVIDNEEKEAFMEACYKKIDQFLK